MEDADDSFEYLDCSSSESGSSVDVTSTAIVIVSPSESSEDGDEGHSKNNRSSQEMFQTPPEDSNAPTSEGITPLPEVDRSNDGRHYGDVGDGNGIIVAFHDGTGAMDLGRDTDLGFSEEQMSEFEVLRRDLSPEGGVSESPSKKLRVTEEDLGISEHKELVPYNPGCSFGEILELDSDNEKPDSGGSESESIVEETESESEKASDVGRQECVEVVMERIPNVTIGELRRMVSRMQRQDLPPSIAEPSRSSTVDDKKEVQKEFSILDVLKLLKNRHKGDGGSVDAVGNCSFLEIYRRRGMTFPGHFGDPKVGSDYK